MDFVRTLKDNSHRTGVSTFASRTSPSTDQSLQKSFHLSSPDKIELKKISSSSENKKYPTAQPDTTKTMKLSIDNGLQGRRTEGQLITAVLRNGGFSGKLKFSFSNQYLWWVDSFVLRNPPLRKAANR